MREFIKSLKRLFQKSLVTPEKINELYLSGIISYNEYSFITN